MLFVSSRGVMIVGNDMPSFDGGPTCPNCGETYERVGRSKCRHQVNKCITLKVVTNFCIESKLTKFENASDSKCGVMFLQS